MAKVADRTLVFKAGLLELEGGGLQAWFVAKEPNRLAAMKVRASWMQRNILNVGWHRSEMERWDELSIGHGQRLEGIRQLHRRAHRPESIPALAAIVSAADAGARTAPA